MDGWMDQTVAIAAVDWACGRIIDRGYCESNWRNHANLEVFGV